MMCQFQRAGDVLTCSRCGRTVKTQHPPERVRAFCRDQRRFRGLGDVLAALFRRTGIERAVKATGKPCRCKQRQEALNRAVPFNARRS